MLQSIKHASMPAISVIVGVRTVYDQNDMEWRLTRTRDGLYVEYRGTDYFKQNEFRVYMSESTVYVQRNTGIVFDGRVKTSPGKRAAWDGWRVYETWLRIFEHAWTDDVWAHIEGVMARDVDAVTVK